MSDMEALWVKRLAVVTIPLAFMIAIVLKVNSFTAHDKFLIAKFHDSNDEFKIQELIYRTLQESIADQSKISIEALNLPILETDGVNQPHRCLEDCGGTALIWGYYSTNQNGNLILHIDFSKKCLEKWSLGQYRTFKLGMDTKNYEESIEKQVQSSVAFIKIFGPLITGAATCQYPEVPAEKLREIDTYIADQEAKDDAGNLNTAYTFAADYYFKKNDNARASNYLSKASKKFPTDIDVLGFYALVLRRLNQYPEAIGTITQALAVEPQNPILWNNLGVLLRETRNPLDAEKAYKLAIHNSNHDVSKETLSSFYSNLGSLEESQNQFQQAISSYTKALETDSHKVKNYLWRAQAYLAMKKTREGQADLSSYLEKNPKDIKALVQNCRAEIMNKNIPRAKAACLKAQEVEPESLLLRDTIIKLNLGELPNTD